MHTVVPEDYIAKNLNLQINRKGDNARLKQTDLVPRHAQKPWVPVLALCPSPPQGDEV